MINVLALQSWPVIILLANLRHWWIRQEVFLLFCLRYHQFFSPTTFSQRTFSRPKDSLSKQCTYRLLFDSANGMKIFFNNFSIVNVWRAIRIWATLKAWKMAVNWTIRAQIYVHYCLPTKCIEKVSQRNKTSFKCTTASLFEFFESFIERFCSGGSTFRTQKRTQMRIEKLKNRRIEESHLHRFDEKTKRKKQVFQMNAKLLYAQKIT